jgi:hypothetical protein
MSGASYTRRQLLALASGAALVGAMPRDVRAALVRAVRRGDHPTPRPGIDASKVLPADQLHTPDAAPIFDLVREVPQVVDGIRCHCGCADLPGNYSLLSCYEAPGMAQHCEICQGQAKLVHRLHRQGWSLAGIRTAVDAAFADAAPSGSC